ncbi:MAG: hypothetical protein ACYCPF_01305 [Streptosporangiaceae bacterium]
MKHRKSTLAWPPDGPGLVRVFGVSWNPDASGSIGFLQRVLAGGRRYAGTHRRRRKAPGPVVPVAGPAASRFVIGHAAVVR